MSKLTELDIPIHSGNDFDISFMIVQTHLKQAGQSMEINQIDQLLCKIYGDVGKVMKEREGEVSGSKEMLSQCNKFMEEFRGSQEQLFQVSKDRLRLVQELKESTDESLGYLDENQKLKQMIKSLQTLNAALTERYEVMQKQLDDASKTNFRSSIKGLSQSYDEIASVNSQMQKQMGRLSELSTKFQNLTLPIRVIKVAFNSRSQLRELVMRQAEEELGKNQQLRDLFMSSSFDLGEVMK